MLNSQQLVEIADREMGEGGLYVYDLAEMRETVGMMQSAGEMMPAGITVRYAVKANSDKEIISNFDDAGAHFDASSVNEAIKLLDQGVHADKISLCSQTLPVTLPESRAKLQYVLDIGVKPIATSLDQIGKLADFGAHTMAVRPNPGRGSGAYNRTTVGGPASSFGIWHEQLDEAKRRIGEHEVTVDRIHTHIGSGVDPDVWRDTTVRSLDIAEQFPDATTLDIGGGYKVGRMPDEPSTDMEEVLGIFAEELNGFAERTGRELHLEIEPGTFLVANAGVLLTRVEEIKSTSKYDFIILNAGMNALMRTVLYGAQHPVAVLNGSEEKREFVVCGNACESGDMHTPVPNNPEEIEPVTLNVPEIGSTVAIYGVGAYAKTLRAARYNELEEPTSVYV